MKIDIVQLLIDYNVYIDPKGKNCSSGWINIQCPFCDDNSNHLGINLKNGNVNCWKCGHKSLYNLIYIITGKNISKIYQKYISKNSLNIGIESIKKQTKYNHIADIEKSLRIVNYPANTSKIQAEHMAYLKSRNFNPFKLEKLYRIKGTGNIGNYKNRIIFPIFLNNKLISYQGRDITGSKSNIKYKACSKKLEVEHHKNTLYNIDNVKRNEIIVVEGVLDAIRLGDNTVATFGVEYTQSQLLMLSKYKKVNILYDTDEAGKKASEKLANGLSNLKVNVDIFRLDEEDPGSLSEKDAMLIKKDIFG